MARLRITDAEVTRAIHVIDAHDAAEKLRDALRTAKDNPDLVVRFAGTVMILDVKYKEELPDVPADDAVSVTLGARTIRVRRTDVYQAV
jgi:hypothetical protein